ncbi:MAG: Lytic transglycosylase catalytic [Oscillospiraceae bacterium]|nr:Lytic transglycosylase catalytic [Oscillospiraceae bacterium]
MAKSKINGFISLLLLVGIIITGYFATNEAFKFYYSKVYPIKYCEYVEKYSEQYQVDKNLVYAVIHTESSFMPNAQSDKKARGLMQIMESTFEWAKSRMNDKRDINYDSLYDPETNIQYGTYILSLLLKEFKSQETAVAAYHAGWGNVKNWLDDPEKSSNGVDIDSIPIGDTKTYVSKVTNTHGIYHKIYDK